MFSTYSDFAPVIILLTLILSLIIGRGITRDSLKGIAGIFAALGFLFGLFMTFMNLIYTSKDLFLLSPVIALSCVLYLRYRSRIEIRPNNSLLQISNRNKKILSIIWCILICAAMLTYYLSEIYTRHPFFFVFIAGAVAILAIQIVTSNPKKYSAPIYITKILILSLILRYSSYFVSPYPIGSDPWVHQEYILYFLDLGRVAVPPDFINYYINYPMAHLYAASTVLLGSISTHDAMFLLGVVLTLSTIVTFLIVRMLTGNVQLALISMLLLNFTDAHIQWSIQIIAMSFAIALYAFIIFFALKMLSKPEEKKVFFILLLIFLSIIVWTHTISAFVALVSLCALIAGQILYDILYNKNNFSFKLRDVQILLIPLIFLLIIIICHWMDPSYSFFNKTFETLLKSLSIEVKFLGAVSLSNITDRWENLMQPIGFCIYVCLGIIGTIYCLSDKERARKYFPIIFLVLVLFFVRYAFPIMGMRNIIPDRWPSFAFTVFALFIGIGIFCCINLMKKKNTILCAVAIFFFIGSFMMITNPSTNQDSPIYGEEVFLKQIWTESEISMYTQINEIYDGKISADEHTQSRPFGIYLKNKKTSPYRILPNGEMDLEFLSSRLVIWNKDSLNRPVHVQNSHYVTKVLLGDQFWNFLNNNYSCISDAHTTRGYLPSIQNIQSHINK